jgi:hypothetical protein
MIELNKNKYTNNENIDSTFYDIDKDEIKIFIVDSNKSDYPQSTVTISKEENTAIKLISAVYGLEDKILNEKEIDLFLKEYGIENKYMKDLKDLINISESEIFVELDNEKSYTNLQEGTFISREGDFISCIVVDSGELVSSFIIRPDGSGSLLEKDSSIDVSLSISQLSEKLKESGLVRDQVLDCLH